MARLAKLGLDPSTDSSSSGSSNGCHSVVLSLSDLKMGLHDRQRDLILNDMAASRKKLEEENQMLRDELSDALLTIRLLKSKLADLTNNRHGGGAGAAAPAGPGGWFRNREPRITQKELREFSGATNQPFLGKLRAKPSRKEAFRNPNAPGRKVFSHGERPPVSAMTQQTRETNSVSSRPSISHEKRPPMPAMARQTRETELASSRPSNNHSISHQKQTTAPSQPKRQHSRGPKIPDRLPQPSAMDRLAWTIIQEHRQCDDKLFLDGESDM